MSATSNTTIVHRFFDEVLTRQSERAVDELIAAGASVCLPTGRYTGPEGVKRASAQITAVFPDRRVKDGKIVDHWMTEGVPGLNFFQPQALRA